MTIQLAFVLFIGIALVGWAIAELKGKMTFTHSEIEKEEAAEIEAQKKAENFHEKNLKDLLKNNSTKGYNAVG